MSDVKVKRCVKCEIMKPLTAFHVTKNGIDYYDQCTDCWRKASVLWWGGKAFKVCKRCEHKLPIRMFDRDSYGAPYSNCIPCHEVEVDERYRRERSPTRALAKKVTFPTVPDAKPIIH